MKVIVIGGVAAGTSFMAKVRRNTEDMEIVCYTKRSEISYSSCGIPYYIGEDYIPRENLLPRDEKWFKDRFEVDIKTRHEVVEVDSKEKKVRVKVLESGKEFWDNYDKLVVASGGRPRKLPFTGEDVFTVRSVEDGDRIKEYIEKNSPKKAIVVGGGFIGLEMVDNLVKKGLKVTLVEGSNIVGGNIDKDISKYLEDYLVKNDVELILEDIVVERVDGYIITKNGRKLEGDIVVAGIGIVGNSEFLEGSGVEILKGGIVDVDKEFKTSVEDIYAIGDISVTYNLIDGEKTYIPLGSTANKEGRILGDALSGGRLKYKGVLGTSIFKVLGLTLGKTGFTEKEAREKGYDVEVIHNIKPNQTAYLKESKEMLIKGIADRKTGRILGVEIIGEVGVDKRLDVFATAISYSGKVEDLFHIDLAYAPPFSTTKDPVAYTGMALDNGINGRNKIITPRELVEDRSSYLVVDVRASKQYEADHIGDAINIPLKELRARISEIPKDRKVVVHCNKGTTGNAAQNVLLNYGYEVYNLSGGYKNYTKTNKLY